VAVALTQYAEIAEPAAGDLAEVVQVGALRAG
jgi:hypothetical protein